MIPVQIRATGADPWLAAGVLGLSTLSIVLSVLIAALLIRGYRRGPRHTGTLTLAVGLVLLTTVPEILRIGLPTFTAVDTVGRSIVTSGCELVGLGAVLWAVYGRGSR